MTERRLQQLADIAYDIIGAAMEVHNEYGFGISEGVYEEALCIELGNEYGYETEAQCDLPVYYKGQLLEKRFRLDIVVEKDVIVELKAVSELLDIHKAQVRNYLALTGLELGLLYNFNDLYMQPTRILNPNCI
jgi:GxxExxY protein